MVDERRSPMKNLLAFISVLFFLVLLSDSAYADPVSCPYDPHLSIMYNYLTTSQRDLYDRLYDAIFNGEDSVRVPAGVNRNDATWMIDYIFNEAAELCALDHRASKVVDRGSYLEIQIVYKLSVQAQKDFVRQIQQLSDSFSDRNENDGVRAIFDYIIRRFDYGTVVGEDTQFAYYALKNNKAVCNGYAQTIAMLCHFSGYSCSYIDGSIYENSGEYIGRHAWNVAFTDARYNWFDATWADNSGGWYNMDGRSMSRTHMPDPEYSPIINLISFLPDNVRFTTHLDVNNKKGYKYGLGEENGMTVSQAKLWSDEYYAPALVIWNYSSNNARVSIGYCLDGVKLSFNEATIAPGSNLAFRTLAQQLKGKTGTHRIIWYCNGFVLRTFTWTVS